MILNELDLKVLRAFKNVKEKDRIDIVKTLFPNGQSLEYMNVKKSLEKMTKYGLFLKTANCRYLLIHEFVKIEKFKFPDRTTLGIGFKINNLWYVIES